MEFTSPRVDQLRGNARECLICIGRRGTDLPQPRDASTAATAREDIGLGEFEYMIEVATRE